MQTNERGHFNFCVCKRGKKGILEFFCTSPEKYFLRSILLQWVDNMEVALRLNFCTAWRLFSHELDLLLQTATTKKNQKHVASVPAGTAASAGRHGEKGHGIMHDGLFSRRLKCCRMGKSDNIWEGVISQQGQRTHAGSTLVSRSCP